jgi:hypothetical protein
VLFIAKLVDCDDHSRSGAAASPFLLVVPWPGGGLAAD